MKVIICENDIVQRKFIQDEIVKYASFRIPSIEIILAASSGNEVISYTTHHHADCYFIDIELDGEINGLKLAKLIRERDPVANIIFITTFADKLKLTFKYKIAALDYIVKSTNRESLSKNITDALNTAFVRYLSLGQNFQAEILQIKIGDGMRNIKYEDIYYFETSTTAHKIKLHSKNGIYEYYGKLKDMEKLDERFWRCHNSYLINRDYLEHITPKKRILLMSNGHECLVSNRYLRDMKKKFSFEV